MSCYSNIWERKNSWFQQEFHKVVLSLPTLSFLTFPTKRPMWGFFECLVLNFIGNNACLSLQVMASTKRAKTGSKLTFLSVFLKTFRHLFRSICQFCRLVLQQSSSADVFKPHGGPSSSTFQVWCKSKPACWSLRLLESQHACINKTPRWAEWELQPSEKHLLWSKTKTKYKTSSLFTKFCDFRA